MDFPPQRAFGNSHLARFVGIESAEPRFFGDVVADCHPVTVLDGEGNDGVAVSLERSLRRQLEDPDLEVLLFATECDRAPQLLLGADWSVKVHRLGAALERQRPQQSDDAKHVVGMHVGEKNVGQREGNSVTHHLPLRSFAAVKHQRLAFANDSDGRDVALNSRARR